MTKRNMLIISLSALAAAGAFVVAGRTRAAGDLTPKEARKLIARMAGIELPSDAVRVKDISTAGNTAIVVAQVETAFRLVKDDKDKWRIAEIRTGDRRWEDLDTLMKALNVEKAARARAELESIATALESFRRERGFKPYEYEGERTSFVLRSNGPDGKPGTADDVTVSSGSR